MGHAASIQADHSSDKHHTTGDGDGTLVTSQIANNANNANNPSNANNTSDINSNNHSNDNSSSGGGVFANIHSYAQFLDRYSLKEDISSYGLLSSASTIGLYERKNTYVRSSQAPALDKEIPNECTLRLSSSSPTPSSSASASASLLRLKTEIQILRSLNGVSNVVKSMASFVDSGNLYLVLEAMPKYDLIEFCCKSKHRHSPSNIKNILRNILNTVKSIHESGVVLCDLRPENIRITIAKDASTSSTSSNLNPSYRVVFCDFSLAWKVEDNGVRSNFNHFSIQSIRNLPTYTPPEALVLENKKIPKKRSLLPSIDVWSLGVIMFQLFTGYLPFYSDSSKKFKKRIYEGKCNFIDEFWKPIPNYLLIQQVILKMLNVEAAERPSIQSILSNSEYFTPSSMKGGGDGGGGGDNPADWDEKEEEELVLSKDMLTEYNIRRISRFNKLSSKHCTDDITSDASVAAAADKIKEFEVDLLECNDDSMSYDPKLLYKAAKHKGKQRQPHPMSSSTNDKTSATNSNTNRNRNRNSTNTKDKISAHDNNNGSAMNASTIGSGEIKESKDYKESKDIAIVSLDNSSVSKVLLEASRADSAAAAVASDDTKRMAQKRTKAVEHIKEHKDFKEDEDEVRGDDKERKEGEGGDRNDVPGGSNQDGIKIRSHQKHHQHSKGIAVNHDDDDDDKNKDNFSAVPILVASSNRIAESKDQSQLQDSSTVATAIIGNASQSKEPPSLSIIQPSLFPSAFVPTSNPNPNPNPTSIPPSYAQQPEVAVVTAAASPSPSLSLSVAAVVQAQTSINFTEQMRAEKKVNAQLNSNANNLLIKASKAFSSPTQKRNMTPKFIRDHVNDAKGDLVKAGIHAALKCCKVVIIASLQLKAKAGVITEGATRVINIKNRERDEVEQEDAAAKTSSSIYNVFKDKKANAGLLDVVSLATNDDAIPTTSTNNNSNINSKIDENKSAPVPTTSIGNIQSDKAARKAKRAALKQQQEHENMEILQAVATILQRIIRGFISRRRVKKIKMMKMKEKKATTTATTTTKQQTNVKPKIKSTVVKDKAESKNQAALTYGGEEKEEGKSGLLSREDGVLTVAKGLATVDVNSRSNVAGNCNPVDSRETVSSSSIPIGIVLKETAVHPTKAVNPSINASLPSNRVNPTSATSNSNNSSNNDKKPSTAGPTQEPAALTAATSKASEASKGLVSKQEPNLSANVDNKARNTNDNANTRNNTNSNSNYRSVGSKRGPAFSKSLGMPLQPADLDHFAIKIQSNYRGYMVRALVKNLQEQYFDNLSDSAIIIQRAFRAFIEYRDQIMQQIVDSAVVIQRAYRSYLHRTGRYDDEDEIKDDEQQDKHEKKEEVKEGGREGLGGKGGGEHSSRAGTGDDAITVSARQRRKSACIIQNLYRRWRCRRNYLIIRDFRRRRRIEQALLVKFPPLEMERWTNATTDGVAAILSDELVDEGVNRIVQIYRRKYDAILAKTLGEASDRIEASCIDSIVSVSIKTVIVEAIEHMRIERETEYRRQLEVQREVELRNYEAMRSKKAQVLQNSYVSYKYRSKKMENQKIKADLRSKLESEKAIVIQGAMKRSMMRKKEAERNHYIRVNKASTKIQSRVRVKLAKTAVESKREDRDKKRIYDETVVKIATSAVDLTLLSIIDEHLYTLPHGEITAMFERERKLFLDKVVVIQRMYRLNRYYRIHFKGVKVNELEGQYREARAVKMKRRKEKEKEEEDAQREIDLAAAETARLAQVEADKLSAIEAEVTRIAEAYKQQQQQQQLQHEQQIKLEEEIREREKEKRKRVEEEREEEDRRKREEEDRRKRRDHDAAVRIQSLLRGAHERSSSNLTLHKNNINTSGASTTTAAPTNDRGSGHSAVEQLSSNSEATIEVDKHNSNHNSKHSVDTPTSTLTSTFSSKDRANVIDSTVDVSTSNSCIINSNSSSPIKGPISSGSNSSRNSSPLNGDQRQLSCSTSSNAYSNPNPNPNLNPSHPIITSPPSPIGSANANSLSSNRSDSAVKHAHITSALSSSSHQPSNLPSSQPHHSESFSMVDASTSPIHVKLVSSSDNSQNNYHNINSYFNKNINNNVSSSNNNNNTNNDSYSNREINKDSDIKAVEPSGRCQQAFVSSVSDGINATSPSNVNIDNSSNSNNSNLNPSNTRSSDYSKADVIMSGDHNSTSAIVSRGIPITITLPNIVEDTRSSSSSSSSIPIRSSPSPNPNPNPTNEVANSSIHHGSSRDESNPNNNNSNNNNSSNFVDNNNNAPNITSSKNNKSLGTSASASSRYYNDHNNNNNSSSSSSNNNNNNNNNNSKSNSNDSSGDNNNVNTNTVAEDNKFKPKEHSSTPKESSSMSLHQSLIEFVKYCNYSDEHFSKDHKVNKSNAHDNISSSSLSKINNTSNGSSNSSSSNSNSIKKPEGNTADMINLDIVIEQEVDYLDPEYTYHQLQHNNFNEGKRLQLHNNRLLYSQSSLDRRLNPYRNRNKMLPTPANSARGGDGGGGGGEIGSNSNRNGYIAYRSNYEDNISSMLPNVASASASTTNNNTTTLSATATAAVITTVKDSLVTVDAPSTPNIIVDGDAYLDSPMDFAITATATTSSSTSSSTNTTTNRTAYNSNKLQRPAGPGKAFSRTKDAWTDISASRSKQQELRRAGNYSNPNPNPNLIIRRPYLEDMDESGSPFVDDSYRIPAGQLVWGDVGAEVEGEEGEIDHTIALKYDNRYSDDRYPADRHKPLSHNTRRPASSSSAITSASSSSPYNTIPAHNLRLNNQQMHASRISSVGLTSSHEPISNRRYESGNGIYHEDDGDGFDDASRYYSNNSNSNSNSNSKIYSRVGSSFGRRELNPDDLGYDIDNYSFNPSYQHPSFNPSRSYRNSNSNSNSNSAAGEVHRFGYVFLSKVPNSSEYYGNNNSGNGNNGRDNGSSSSGRKGWSDVEPQPPSIPRPSTGGGGGGGGGGGAYLSRAGRTSNSSNYYYNGSSGNISSGNIMITPAPSNRHIRYKDPYSNEDTNIIIDNNNNSSGHYSNSSNNNNHIGSSSNSTSNNKNSSSPVRKRELFGYSRIYGDC